MIISTLEKNYLSVPYEWTHLLKELQPKRTNQAFLNHLNWCFPLDFGRLKELASFSAFLGFSEYYAKENNILQYFSKYFICEFLYLWFILFFHSVYHFLIPFQLVLNLGYGFHLVCEHVLLVCFPHRKECYSSLFFLIRTLYEHEPQSNPVALLK